METQGEHAEHIVQRGGFGRCQDEKQTPWRDADEGGIQNSAVFITEHQPLRRNSTQRDIASRDQHMSAAPGADVSAGSADQSALIDQFGVGDQIFYLIGVRFLPVHWTSSQRHIIFQEPEHCPYCRPSGQILCQ